MDLITDRDQYIHVNLLKRLQAKGWDNMSASEKAQWYSEAAKGAYNYTDLNRVESAVAEISEIFDLGLTTKTNWTLWDIPTKADMERYLSNISVIWDMNYDFGFVPGIIHGTFEVPYLPKSMDNLTCSGANAIEKTLEIAYFIATSRLDYFILDKSWLMG